MPNNIKLRNYQNEALEATLSSYAAGITRPLVVLPTGSGKTVVFAALLEQRRGRGLVLAHRDELISQAVEKINVVAPGLRTGVVKAGQNEVKAPVVVASVQTLARDGRLKQIGNNFQTVVVDEAHHAPATSYKKVLEYLGCMTDGGPLTLGVTATPERGDKIGLAQVWQKIVYQRTILQMILDGYLSDIRAIRVALEVDLDSVSVSKGDFSESDLGDALMDADAPQHVLEAYQQHAAERKALIFTPTVKLAHKMAGIFKANGIPAEAVDGTTPPDERRGILRRLHSGLTHVVANCGVLTEGFDEPSIDCVIVARPTKSKPLYIQMIGRGTRPYPGKSDCLVIDVVGVSHRHSLATATSILDMRIEQTAREAALARNKPLPVGETDYVPAGQLVVTSSQLFGARSAKWVQTELGAWVLNVGGELLRLEPGLDDKWDVVSVGKDVTQSLYQKLPLAYAMGAAEDAARTKGAGNLVNPNARWRREPATEKQINALERWRVVVPSDLTRGQASDMLTALVGDKHLVRR